MRDDTSEVANVLRTLLPLAGSVLIRAMQHGLLAMALLTLAAVTCACSSDDSSAGQGGSAGAGGNGTGGGAGAGAGVGGALDPPYTGPPGAFVDPTPSPVPGTWPSGLTYTALAHDGTQGKLLFFPHEIATADFEIWDWDGPTASFTQRTPSALPAGWPLSQSGYSAAYDPQRKVVVLYGRVSGLPDLATLEWEPATGDLRDVSPPNPGWNWPSDNAFLFFDDALAAVVQYAGDRLLRWDPTAGTWVDSTPITFPVGFQGLSHLAHDRARGKLYGFDVYATPVKVAELDLTTGIWTPRNPMTFPPDWPAPVNVASATYAESIDRVVITGAPGAASPGTFEWDPTAGTMKKYPVSDPSEMPVGGDAAYDATTGFVTAITANYDHDGYLGDVFTWENGAWVRHRPSHVEQTWPRPEDAPLAQTNCIALTYDPHRARSLLFLNSRADEPMGATLEWDGNTWTDRTPADPAASPPARYEASLAYDVGRKRAVLYGGRTQTDHLYDTWEWDSDTATWIDRTPTSLPPEWPAVNGPMSLAYDAAAAAIILVSNDAKSTWIWDGATGSWARPVPDGFSPAPLGVSSSGVTYDERLKLPLLIANGFGDEQKAWSFDDAKNQWVELAPAAAPPAGLEYMKVAYDRVRGTALSLGWAGATTLLSFDPPARVWADESPASPPPSWPSDNQIEIVGGMTYDAARETLVIVFRDGRVVERPSK